MKPMSFRVEMLGCGVAPSPQRTCCTTSPHLHVRATLVQIAQLVVQQVVHLVRVVELGSYSRPPVA